jgi:hypothetical protein
MIYSRQGGQAHMHVNNKPWPLSVLCCAVPVSPPSAPPHSIKIYFWIDRYMLHGWMHIFIASGVCCVPCFWSREFVVGRGAGISFLPPPNSEYRSPPHSELAASIPAAALRL